MLKLLRTRSDRHLLQLSIDVTLGKQQVLKMIIPIEAVILF